MRIGSMCASAAYAHQQYVRIDSEYVCALTDIGMRINYVQKLKPAFNAGFSCIMRMFLLIRGFTGLVMSVVHTKFPGSDEESTGVRIASGNFGMF